MKQYDIFISYRRDGGEALACLLSEKLKQMQYDVFYDVESLRSGKFNNEIYNVIENCKDVICVLPENGLERCADAEDWVRKEIAYAIKCKKNIVPVMMRNFKFPKQLPNDIRELPNYNGISANMEYFDASYNKLLDLLITSKETVSFDLKNYIKDEKELERIEQLKFEIHHNGSSDSMVELAKIYRKTSSEKLHNIAKSLMQKAADNDNDDARLILGKDYMYGSYNTNIDDVKAFDYLYKAANNGNDIAQYHLSIYFKTENSKKLRTYWLKKSAMQNNTSALKALAKLYETVFIDNQLSDEYYKKLADNGDKKAARKLLWYNKIFRRIKSYFSF